MHNRCAKLCKDILPTTCYAFKICLAIYDDESCINEYDTPISFTKVPNLDYTNIHWKKKITWEYSKNYIWNTLIQYSFIEFLSLYSVSVQLTSIGFLRKWRDLMTSSVYKPSIFLMLCITRKTFGIWFSLCVLITSEVLPECEKTMAMIFVFNETHTQVSESHVSTYWRLTTYIMKMQCMPSSPKMWYFSLNACIPS